MKKLILRVLYLLNMLIIVGCATTYHPQTYLEGNISVHEPIPYRNEELHIQIRLTEQDINNKTQSIIAEQYINNPSERPIKFSLYYDKNSLNKNSIYAIEAQLFARGNLIMQTEGPIDIQVPFPSGGNLQINLHSINK